MAAVTWRAHAKPQRDQRRIHYPTTDRTVRGIEVKGSVSCSYSGTQAATAMNERSSHVHTVFIVTLKQPTQRQVESLSDSQPVFNTVESHLLLADLGGSEQVKKSLVKGGRKDDHIGYVLEVYR